MLAANNDHWITFTHSYLIYLYVYLEGNDPYAVMKRNVSCAPVVISMAVKGSYIRSWKSSVSMRVSDVGSLRQLPPPTYMVAY